MSRVAFALIAAILLPGLAQAAETDPLKARWGLYADLAAGKVWAHELSSGAHATARYTWVRQGEELRAEHRLTDGKGVTVETITVGAEPQTLIVMTREDADAPTRSVVVLNEDGSATETFVAKSGVNGRSTYSMSDPAHYRAFTEAEVDGEWRGVYASDAVRVEE